MTLILYGATHHPNNYTFKKILLVLIQQFKHPVESSRSNTGKLLTSITNDGKCFSRACLTIGENAHIVAINSRLN